MKKEDSRGTFRNLHVLSLMSSPVKLSRLCYFLFVICTAFPKKSKRKVQGVPQSQTAALPRHQKEQEEEETDKTKQAQIEQTYEKH